MPVAYHGRASSVRVSGTPVKRPQGQRKGPDETAPSYGPSRNMDFELELGMYIGTPTALGETVPVGKAASHIFGFCLLNDWSARDVQAWEYQPLGPFLGKNFATTVSPWVVTQEALAPFRAAAFARPEGDPAPLPYLTDADDQAHGGLDVTLEAYLATEAMRRAGTAPQRLTRTSFATTYWTVAQMVAHHTCNGCNLVAGDLIGSGTVSGPEKEAGAAFLNLPRAGASRSHCRPASSAASSRTATRSSSKAFAPNKIIRASASANAGGALAGELTSSPARSAGEGDRA